jgi:hypothetical protein
MILKASKFRRFDSDPEVPKLYLASLPSLPLALFSKKEEKNFTSITSAALVAC